MKIQIKKKSYEHRSDKEKLKDNWGKTLFLLTRKEYSMSIVRAGTCAEIAVNLMVREELCGKRKLKAEFVDSLLGWANGLHGKITKILKPLLRGSSEGRRVAAIEGAAKKLSEARNKIAHGGHFAAEKHAKEMANLAHKICMTIVEAYAPQTILRRP